MSGDDIRRKHRTQALKQFWREWEEDDASPTMDAITAFRELTDDDMLRLRSQHLGIDTAAVQRLDAKEFENEEARLRRVEEERTARAEEAEFAAASEPEPEEVEVAWDDPAFVRQRRRNDATDREMARVHYQQSRTRSDKVAAFSGGLLGCLVFLLAISPVPTMFVGSGLEGFGVEPPVNWYLGVAVQFVLIVYVGRRWQK